MYKRQVDGGTLIERLRYTIAPGGRRTSEPNAITLAECTVAGLHGEGAAAGLEPAGERHVVATADHVGSEVVLLRG